jgi:hypothetical protein
MAARAATVLNAPGKAHDIGAAARRFVLQHHAWPAMLEPLGTLIHRPSAGARHAA